MIWVENLIHSNFISIHYKYCSIRNSVSKQKKKKRIVRNENQIPKAGDNATGKIGIYGIVRASNFHILSDFCFGCSLLDSGIISISTSWIGTMPSTFVNSMHAEKKDSNSNNNIVLSSLSGFISFCSRWNNKENSAVNVITSNLSFISIQNQKID